MGPLKPSKTHTCQSPWNAATCRFWLNRSGEAACLSPQLPGVWVLLVRDPTVELHGGNRNTVQLTARPRVREVLTPKRIGVRPGRRPRLLLPSDRRGGGLGARPARMDSTNVQLMLVGFLGAPHHVTPGHRERRDLHSRLGPVEHHCVGNSSRARGLSRETPSLCCKKKSPAGRTWVDGMRKHSDKGEKFVLAGSSAGWSTVP